MSQNKKIFLALSYDEYSLLEKEAQKKNVNTDILVSGIVKKYLKAVKMKNGYEEMAQINLKIAQMCFDADEQCLRQCEEKLTECE